MTQPNEPVRAVTIARDLKLTPAAQALVREDFTPVQFLAALDAHDLLDDGLFFLAHWLPRREAVWWGCQCIWHLQRPMPPSKVEHEALQAVVAWVVEPNEKQRRAVEKAAEAAGMTTPAGCVARAAFCSGGSISLPNCPNVDPPPLATANMVARALILATTTIAEATAHRHRFLQLGVQIAEGKHRWDRPRAAAQA